MLLSSKEGVWGSQGRPVLESEHSEGPSVIRTALPAEYSSLTFVSLSASARFFPAEV